MSNEKFMKMALELARKRAGFTSPNPVVGAVIVKNNKVISAASHRKAGLPHAEAEALKIAGEGARGAKLYVTLEPCVHFGKTPPCSDAVIKSGIKEVVVAVKDPNPINNGRGIRKLRKAGVKVSVGMLKQEAGYQNRAFFKFITKKIPYVIIKVAQSIDGKIATHTGDSKWITSEKSRQYVQKLRQEVDAILVGVRTIINDNPQLTCRLKPKKLLTKIVLDPELETPPQAKIFRKAKRIILVTKKGNLPLKKEIYRGKAEILEVDCNKKGRLNLCSALKKIAGYDVVTIMVEGGGETISSFVEENLVDEMFIFIAPKIIGGRAAPTAVEGEGMAKINVARRVKSLETEKIGGDLLLKIRY